MNMNLFTFFDIFAPEGKYPPCGMFTLPHIIALIISFIVIAICIFLSRHFKEQRIRNIVFILGIIVTVLEVIKISYKFFINHTPFVNLIEWMPLFFCSLYIYAALLAKSKNEIYRKVSDAYIGGGALIGGLVFLIFPTTSLNDVPIFHFLSLHSFFYHSCLVYSGIMYLCKGIFKPTLKNYIYYLYFVGGVIFIDCLLNIYVGSNLMLLAEPVNFPLEIAYIVYDHVPWVFTLISIMVYLSLYFVSMLLYKLIFKRFSKVENQPL